jgi:hypothetical protein
VFRPWLASSLAKNILKNRKSARFGRGDGMTTQKGVDKTSRMANCFQIS